MTAIPLLRRPAAAPRAIEPSADQRRVIDHDAGRLRVLAGPGTGKTATIVEAVAHRVERLGVDPASILVLTFSRRAAGELAARIAARLSMTVSEPMVRTVHSFAYAIERRAAADAGDAPPRLLEAGQADLMVRDLLVGHAEDGGIRWPEELRPALRVPAFAAELREMMARCAEQRVSPRQMARLADRLGRPEWRAVAEFIDEYRDVSDLRSGTVRGGAALDQAELITAALARLAVPATLAALQGRIRRVFVDEYQDVDPAQARLIDLVADAADELVVVGDPDQAIYAFRGASPGAMGRIEVDSEVALTVSRRMRPAIIHVSRRIAALLPGVAAHRELRPARVYDAAAPGPGAAPVRDREDVAGRDGVAGSGAVDETGHVEVRVLARPGQEAAYVADYLRRAHLHDGVPWGQMAVLLRSPRSTGDVFRRALSNAGVPVGAVSAAVVAADPLVAALLTVLRAGHDPAAVTVADAAALLTSPLGGLDPLSLRDLRRSVRRRVADGVPAGSGGPGGVGADPSDADRPESPPRPSVETLGRIVLGEAAVPAGLPRDAELRRVADLVAIARAHAAEPAAENALWRIWQAAGVSDQLVAASRRGGPDGERADAHLDAVMELFDRAADLAVQVPSAGIGGLLDVVANEMIAAAADGSRVSDSVSIVSAHGAKGLEWDLVAVAGVQDETWPDLRPRVSLLGEGELLDAAAGIRAPRAVRTLLAEERRLFYVAVTRARSRLLVTAVDDGEVTPSRFLTELVEADAIGRGWPRGASGRPRRSLTMASLVAELRDVAAGDDESRARAAAAQLADLAAHRIGGADPAQWYGLAPLSTTQPLVDDGEPVPLSPSQWDSALQCPLRTVLDRSGGRAAPGEAQQLGIAVHALAEGLAAGADDATITAAIDEFLAARPEQPSWETARLRRRMTAMYEALARWVQGHATDRERIGSEASVDLVIDVPGDQRVRLRGRIDWLALDTDGRYVITDFKTGSSVPSIAEMPDHAQLAAYQLVVALGGLSDGLLPDGAQPGGAELVYVASGSPKVRSQAALVDEDRDRWLDSAAEVARALSGARFTARIGSYCDRCPVRSSCPIQPEGRQVTR